MKPLRQKMLNDLLIRGLAENTQTSYLQSVTGLARYYHRSPDQLSVQEVQDYLLYLSQERHLAWKSCNTIRHGLRFFYQITLDRPATEFYLPCAKEPSKLPEILSHEELVRLFTVTTNRKHRALLMTTYAAGLRASEVTRPHSAIAAAHGLSAIAPAVIAIARSAKPWPSSVGWNVSAPICWISTIGTWCSPCHMNSMPWPRATRR